MITTVSNHLDFSRTRVTSNRPVRPVMEFTSSSDSYHMQTPELLRWLSFEIDSQSGFAQSVCQSQLVYPVELRLFSSVWVRCGYLTPAAPNLCFRKNQSHISIASALSVPHCESVVHGEGMLGRLRVNRRSGITAAISALGRAVPGVPTTKRRRSYSESIAVLTAT